MVEPEAEDGGAHQGEGAAEFIRLRELVRRRANRPEVTATIAVVHAEGADRPVDACEERCLHEITGKLRELGACEGSWSALPSVE